MDYLKYLFLLLATLATTTLGQDADFWNNQARQTLQQALALQTLNIGEAKNIIFFLGDGMSIPTVSAARIRQGQLNGQTGEENNLAWETFPHVGLIKTYNTDAQTPDSAGTATAFFTGVKTKSGVLGIDDHVEYGNCSTTFGNEVDSVLVEAFHNKNISTGMISTARITHATPGALYAHTPSRNWEANANIPVAERTCRDIAQQLIEDHPYIKVILGGGRRNFYTTSEFDPEDDSDRGHRTDGRNLINEWLENKPNARYVWNKTEFDSIDVQSTDYLFGLFEDSHMRYASEADEGNDPSLASMTEKAIRMLQKDPNGFFLAVEAGRIDHSHHGGNAFNALGDTIAMSDAVAMARSLTSTDDTLIIVTADHAHTMGFAGYPVRGNPILGLSGGTGTDRLPYTTLGYMNGPGGAVVKNSYEENGHRPNLTAIDTEDHDFLQDATVPLTSETHGGDDVAVYASGPMSHLIHGVQEQNYIAHVMRFAGCYDNDEMTFCNSNLAMTTAAPQEDMTTSGGDSLVAPYGVSLVLTLLLAVALI